MIADLRKKSDKPRGPIPTPKRAEDIGEKIRI